MIYYVYQITNKINNKIYIGKRKYKGGNPLLDSYMGSGKLIKEAIKKYGKNNFQKIIIQSFDNEDDAFKLEKNLLQNSVTEKILIIFTKVVQEVFLILIISQLKKEKIL